MKGGQRHHNFKDLTGQKFGMLTAVRATRSNGKTWLWEFECECGNTVEKVAKSVTKLDREGRHPHCGCQTEARMSAPVTQLRRAWHQGLRALAAGVRAFLGGHGAYVPAGVDVGADRQRWALQPRELPVGYVEIAGVEQTNLGTRPARNRRRHAVEADRDQQIDVAVSPEPRMAAGPADAGAELQQPVYDIVDAGPRHRFVVLGDRGPFVVHNCVQSLAGLIMTERVVEFAQTELGRKYPLAHTVHDEIVYVVDNDDADRVLAELLHLMIQPPAWWPELILAAEGSIAQTYGDAK